MKKFIGTKIVTAKPMTRQEYNDYRNWELPADEQSLANEAGFLVEYNDLTHQHSPDHKGYISWSPAVVFEKAYREVIGLPFGMAMEAMLKGHKAIRDGWNGNGMHLEAQIPDKHSKMTHPYLFITIPGCQEGTRLLPWQPAQVDIFATDWSIL